MLDFLLYIIVAAVAIYVAYIYRSRWLPKFAGYQAVRARAESNAVSKSSSAAADVLPGPAINISAKESPLFTTFESSKIGKSLPAKCYNKTWNLLFSTDVDGYSLQTLYNKTKGHAPLLMVLLDSSGSTFGVFSSHSFNGGNEIFSSNLLLSPGKLFLKQSYTAHASPSSNKAATYFGSGETFIFSLRPSFKVYRWTRKNNLFILARNDCLAFGGGHAFALSIDSNLEEGSTGCSDTFENDLLTPGTGLASPVPSSSAAGQSASSSSSSDSRPATVTFKIIRIQVYSFVQPIVKKGQGSSGGTSARSKISQV
jgi:TLD